MRNLLRRLIRIFKPVLLPIYRWGYRLRAVTRTGSYVETRSGDVVVWTFRLLHSGNAVRPRFAPATSLTPWMEDLLPSAWALPGGHDRMALFSAFARDGACLDRYLAGRSPYDMVHWKHIRYDEDFTREARAAGVRLRNPYLEFGPASSGAA